MVPSSAGTPYLVEFTLSAAASAIEGGDTRRQQLAALEGVLTNYQASRAAGARPEPLLDALLADKAAGRLEERATTLATCINE